MTKYVLNSGGIRRQPGLRNKFHQELVKGLGNQPRFLVCSFAQGREYWESKFANHCELITADMPAGVSPSFELAMPQDFEDQCKRADVIYLRRR